MSQTTPGALEAYRLLVADVYELAGVSRASSEQIARRHGQTAARWHVMSALLDGELTVAAVARRLGLARQSVQSVTDALRADGYVVSRPDPVDRRAPLMRLTEHGRDTVTALFGVSDRARASTLERSGLSEDELLLARATVQKVIAALRAD